MNQSTIIKRFTGKVVIITGAASGIGAAAARLFASEGAKLILTDINPVAGALICDEIGPEYAEFIQADIAQRLQVEAVIARAVEVHGHIDILVNNAGVGCHGRTPDLTPDAWEKVIATDLNAVFYACRVAIPHMRRRGGSIINTASISGLAGDYGFTAYNAAKAGVINYTRALAVDHGVDGIRVNAICPGLIDTPLTAEAKHLPGLEEDWLRAIPLRRAGTASEMASIIGFLASEGASYMTGSIVTADGGISAWSGQPDLSRYGIPTSILR